MLTPSQPEPAGPAPAALLADADRRRQARGLVQGDDPALDQLRARAASLAGQPGQAGPAAQAVADYRRRVEEVVIDAAFIDRKMQRVSERINSSALSGDDRIAELDALSHQALRLALAGDLEASNRVLNQILARTSQPR